MTTKVLVLSMGKAGSTTVINALKSAGIEYGRMHWNNRHEVDPNDYTHFIAMAREPVARSISDYFESGIDIQIGIAQTLAFFDELVKPVTGINIYAKDGPIISYRSMYDSRLCNRLLSVKAEQLSSPQVKVGLANFLEVGLDEITVTHHPKGSERFGPEYDKFRRDFKLPHKYLWEVANHKYCQRFGYTDAVMRWAE